MVALNLAERRIKRLSPMERTGIAVHEMQPPQLSVVFVVPATDKGRLRRQMLLARRGDLHQERWEKFRNRLRKRFSAVAETTAFYHVIEFWECWLCGFDAYSTTVFAWWRSLHFDIRYRIIRDSRRAGRDQLNRRGLLRKAMLGS
jgi:hypothetical protein